MAIKNKTAYKMAIEALTKQALMYDANLHLYFPNYIAGQRAHKAVSHIREAIKIITEEHLAPAVKDLPDS